MTILSKMTNAVKENLQHCLCLLADHRVHTVEKLLHSISEFGIYIYIRETVTDPERLTYFIGGRGQREESFET